MAFLKRLWPDAGVAAPVMVQVVSGRVTAQLRRIWGLNNILSDDGEKTRADHRHHAIDALVVACTHPGITQSLSRYWQMEDDPNIQRPRLDPPWATIRTDTDRAVHEIVVSHRTRRKVSGPFHQEMPLGDTKFDIVKNGVEYGVFAKRVRVEILSLGALKAETLDDLSRTPFLVRDDHVRKVLLAHVETAQSSKAYPPYPRVSPEGPEIRKVRVLALRQRHLMVHASTGFADPANNHHIAIYRLPNGKFDFKAVSLHTAARRLSKREPVVSRVHDSGGVFVMSLAAGDTIRFAKEHGKPPTLWRVQKIASKGQISLLALNDASPQEPSLFEPTVGGIMSRHATKVSVDPIGRIRPAND